MLKVKRMAESIRKPRRTKGTVAYNARRYFGWGVLIVGAACGLIFHFTGVSQPLRQLIYEGKFAATEEELDRKALMSLVPKKRGETIEQQIKESNDPRSY